MKLIKLKGYNKIYSVPMLMDEYQDLFKKSTAEYRESLKKLSTNLKILDSQALGVSLTMQQFEKLTNEEIYSIRHVAKSNERVLFACLDSEENIVLLSCCKEKRNSDYDRAISLAKSRMKEMEVE